jgi:hypothetical protein
MAENETKRSDEPDNSYGNKITFFKSFEEMNEHDHREMASHDPIQSLQIITGMIMEMYKEELQQENDLTIHFK